MDKLEENDGIFLIRHKVKLFHWQKFLSVECNYGNTPMQYIDFSLVVKIENFLLKNFDIFAQTIDCWYTLEPPR